MKIRALFLDVGGVLGTNGWDGEARRKAAAHFQLDLHEMEGRHNLTFDTYEIGKLSLQEYLNRIVFYTARSFSSEDFRQFMVAQSRPDLETIRLIREVRAQYALKIAVLSNEGRELMEYRIPAFGLAEFVDFFIVSCYVHFRKPDVEIFRLALDVAQIPAEQVVYIEDRPMFVDVAQGLGFKAIRHTSALETRAALQPLLE